MDIEDLTDAMNRAFDALKTSAGGRVFRINVYPINTQEGIDLMVNEYDKLFEKINSQSSGKA
jgi:hypothetical protein